MKKYTNAYIGVQFPFEPLILDKEQDGWAVFKHPQKEAYLSVQLCNQFFGTPQEIADYIQTEVQAVSNANNLAQFNGIKSEGNDVVTAEYFQYIDNISHMVFIGAKILPDFNGYGYMAVTKDEAMTTYCDSFFRKCSSIKKAGIGVTDKTLTKQLAGHTLKYFSSYRSDWGSGGGTNTQKQITLHPDQSFRYQYSSVISLGSMGGSTSRDEGWGIWDIQKNEKGTFLLLRWHMKAVSALQLVTGEPGIIFLDNEKYLVD